MASAVDIDSAVVDVISAVGVAWTPPFVMFSAAAVVLTAVDILDLEFLLWLESLEVYCSRRHCFCSVCYWCVQPFWVPAVDDVPGVVNVPVVVVAKLLLVSLLW